MVVSDERGEFVFTESGYGEWIIRETTVPEGYMMADGGLMLIGTALGVIYSMKSWCASAGRKRLGRRAVSLPNSNTIFHGPFDACYL